MVCAPVSTLWAGYNANISISGSDFPYADSDKIAGFREDLDAFHMAHRLREMIYYGNVENLLQLENHAR